MFRLADPLNPISRATLVVRAASNTAGMAGALREAAPGWTKASVYNVKPMDDHLYESLAWRFNMLLLEIFAGIALTLAAVGIYESYLMRRRSGLTNSGIRVALGARPAAILGMVIRQGLVDDRRRRVGDVFGIDPDLIPIQLALRHQPGRSAYVCRDSIGSDGWLWRPVWRRPYARQKWTRWLP
jgi:hypothetical protein